METPIADLIRGYAARNPVRLHMPGHKGKPILGCEPWDITEISGAGSLYEDLDSPETAAGMVSKSESNAAALFGAGKTLYSTEGSSHCIRAMVTLAALRGETGTRPRILAGRNAHKALLFSAALADVDLVWLWPRRRTSLCGCAVSPADLSEALDRMEPSPAAVFLTSPDYLGGMADVSGCAAACHAHGVPLLVDNAHGAFLRFLPESLHPLDLGADVCCDSAHKTLPVLTGGAYLHLSRRAPEAFFQSARAMLALHGSTSPSWLTLASLDLCNRFLAEGFQERLADCVRELEALREALRGSGYAVEAGEALKVTLRGNTARMKERLHKAGIEWEYADRDYLVLMASPRNTPEELRRVAEALGQNDAETSPPPELPISPPERVLTVRQALFAPHRRIPAAQAVGHICAVPTAGCPPAIPVAAAGERIDEACVRLLQYYDIPSIEVVEAL